MKVNDPKGTAIDGIAATKSAPVNPQNFRGLGSAPRNDEIQLSSLSQALAALHTNSPQRDARVGQLSAEVGNGTYTVDPHVLSGSLIRETLAASAG